MATNQIYKYVWLIETIYRAKRITFDNINREWLNNKELSEGVDLPLRTFHKWRIAAEEIFGLNIENEKHGAYRYYIENEEEITKPSMHSWLLNTISVSNTIMENRSLKDRILLENIPSGLKYLQPILNAMKRSLLVHFNYYNYHRDDNKSHNVEPYCVKLFRQRWYLVGREEKINEIRTYSLDRMSKFSILNKTFNYPPSFDPEQFFKDYYGIITDDSTVAESVEVKVDACQANYLRDLPMHHSQREIKRNSECSHFKLKVHPTLDFQQEILWNGEKIEVTKPTWLRKEITEKIKRMGEKYKEKQKRKQ